MNSPIGEIDDKLQRMGTYGSSLNIVNQQSELDSIFTSESADASFSHSNLLIPSQFGDHMPWLDHREPPLSPPGSIKSTTSWEIKKSRAKNLDNSVFAYKDATASRFRASSAPDHYKPEPEAVIEGTQLQPPESTLLQVPLDPHNPARYMSAGSGTDDDSSPVIIRVPSPLIHAIPSPIQRMDTSIVPENHDRGITGFHIDRGNLFETVDQLNLLSLNNSSYYSTQSMTDAEDDDVGDEGALSEDYKESSKLTRTNSALSDSSFVLGDQGTPNREQFEALMAEWEAATYALFRKNTMYKNDDSRAYQHAQPHESSFSNYAPRTPSLTLNNDSTDLLSQEDYFSRQAESNGSLSSAATLSLAISEQALRPFCSQFQAVSNLSSSSSLASLSMQNGSSPNASNSSCSSMAFDNLAQCLEASNLASTSDGFNSSSTASLNSNFDSPWLSTEKVQRKSNTLYQCPQCGKIFHRPYALKSHYKSHSTEKPFVCSFLGCTGAFQRKHDLRRHEKLHSGKKMYICKICDKSFARSDALTRHLKSSDPSQPSVCGYKILELEPGRRLNAKTANKIGNLVTSKKGRPKLSQVNSSILPM